MKMSAPALALCCCASLVGCTGAAHSQSRQHPAASPKYGPVHVSGRAARPVDIDAGAINVLARDLEFGGPPGSKLASVTISYDDWNTIIATSRVPVDIGLMLDPGINADDLIRNRLQYLADRISLMGISKFAQMTILSSPGYGAYNATVALYNPTSDVDEISSLGITIKSKPPQVTIASHKFYSTAHGGCIIPAHTVYFAFLTFPHYNPMPKTATSLSYSYTLSPKNPIVCPGQVCPTGVPIPLCQE